MTGTTLGEIAAALGGELIGDASLAVDRIGPLEGATASTLSFLSNPKYQSQLATSGAAGVIVAPALREVAAARGAAIVTDDPYLYFARATQWWAARQRRTAPPGVHPSAVVDPGARLGAGVSIGPFVMVDADVELGDGVVVGAHTSIGAGSRIGASTRLAPRVTIAERCQVGERCILHSGVVIGADGFGFAPAGGRWEKIEQLGGVRIGDDVEIGANTCIDRGALEDTVIEDGVKLDNLIQIGHNVHVGRHTVIAGCTGIAGSTKIGAHCMIGGAAMFVGHITIVDGTTISGGTLVSRSIRQPGVYTGHYPFDENAAWEKNAATLRQLHAMRLRLRALEKKTPP